MSDSEVVENEIFDGGVVEGSWLRVFESACSKMGE